MYIDIKEDELLLLDGKVEEKLQKIIATIKQERTYAHALPLFGKVITRSLVTGILTCSHRNIRSCPVCHKDAGYARYSRTSGYHLKGDKNFNAPLYLSGYAYNSGFISFQGVGDICQACEAEHHLTQDIIDYIINNELPVEVKIHGVKTKFRKDDLRICYQCKQEMYESEMSRQHTLMGDGTYPAGCPKCGAKSLLFGGSHGVTSKFRMIRTEDGGSHETTVR